MKKRLYLPLFYLLFTITTSFSQAWIAQGKDVLPKGYYTWSISAVDENTVWALCYSAQVTDPKLIRSIDGGESWDVRDLNIGFPATELQMDIHALSGSKIWMVSFDEESGIKTLRLSIDGGNSWVDKFSYQGNVSLSPVLKFSDEQHGFMLEPRVQAFRTSDGGDTWLPSETFKDLFAPDEFWGIVTPTNWMDVRDNTIWWGTNKNIHLSDDGGATWNSTGSKISDNYVNAVAFNSLGIGLAVGHYNNETFETGIWKSESRISQSYDGGKTWRALDNATFPMDEVTAVPRTKSSFVCVGGSFKDFIPGVPEVYPSAFTFDGGRSWRIIDDIPRTNVEFVSPTVGWAGRISSYNYDGNPVIFKWDGTNLRTGHRKGVGSIVKINGKKKRISISPNPFSDRLYIEQEEPGEGIVILKDITGKVVREATFNDLQLELNGLAHLPKGTYFLELKGKNLSATQKLIKQ